MARLVEAACPRPISGLVVARRGEVADGLRTPVAWANHPIPDQSSVDAGARLLDIAAAAGPADDVIVLLSGGASALACLPSPGLAIAKKAALTAALLRSGATVEEINTVRRHLSRIKGGRLAAAAHRARVTTYAISDVISDRAEAIGSGLTVADPTTIADAETVLARYGIATPACGFSESMKPGDSRLARAEFHIIASARTAHAALLAAARAQGFKSISLGADLEGEARAIGARHAEIARACAAHGRPFAIISGGELTVSVTGSGRGGPNFECAAALAIGVSGLDGVAALAADSDGVDGNSGAAGAFVDGSTAARAQRAGFNLETALRNNDCAAAFDAIGGSFAPGMTGTNVNDIRIILVGGSG